MKFFSEQQILLRHLSSSGMTGENPVNFVNHINLVNHVLKTSCLKKRRDALSCVSTGFVCLSRCYFANCTALVSLMTVIFICPGYVISVWIWRERSYAMLSASWSLTLSAPTMTRSSRPAWIA